MEEITPLLRELAAQMNTTVEFLWGVLVRQAQVYAISYIVDTIIVLVIAYLFASVLNHWRRSNVGFDFMEVPTQDEGKWALYLFLSIVLGIITLTGMLAIIFTFNNFLTALLNPEYWALQQILEYIK